jgi:hypothetical protein
LATQRGQPSLHTLLTQCAEACAPHLLCLFACSHLGDAWEQWRHVSRPWSSATTIAAELGEQQLGPAVCCAACAAVPPSDAPADNSSTPAGKALTRVCVGQHAHMLSIVYQVVSRKVRGYLCACPRVDMPRNGVAAVQTCAVQVLAVVGMVGVVVVGLVVCVVAVLTSRMCRLYPTHITHHSSSPTHTFTHHSYVHDHRRGLSVCPPCSLSSHHGLQAWP